MSVSLLRHIARIESLVPKSTTASLQTLSRRSLNTTSSDEKPNEPHQFETIVGGDRNMEGKYSPFQVDPKKNPAGLNIFQKFQNYYRKLDIKNLGHFWTNIKLNAK